MKTTTSDVQRDTAAGIAPPVTSDKSGARNAPLLGTASGTVKSLAKGLRILELLLQRRDVGPTEVAREFSIDKGTASRILKTFVEVGFAVQGAGRRYQPGPKVSGMTKAHSSAPDGSIRACARPLLERLHQVTGETALLALRADDQVLCLDKVGADLPLRVERPIGTLSPLHCTALGRVFLAFSGAPLPRTLGTHATTPIDRDALQAAMPAIIARGYAIDDEESAVGVRCVAAPLRDRTGDLLAAIGLSGPAARISASQLHGLGELVKAIAADFKL